MGYYRLCWKIGISSLEWNDTPRRISQFLYKIQPTRLELVTLGPTDEEASILSEHSKYLESLVNKGVVLVFGRTQNNDVSTFGIVIFQAESEDHARVIMNNDPAVKNGIMRAELFPYKIAGLSSNWKSWIHLPEN